MIYVSGHISKKGDRAWQGKLGKSATTEQGKAAARAVALDIIGTLKNYTSDIDSVKLVKMTGFVNSSPNFTEQHLVMNGATELLLKVFGEENGKHARSAIGVTSLPFGAMLEIELVAEMIGKIKCQE